MSLPMRGAWIEIIMLPHKKPSYWSLPMRGAWIEIEMKILYMEVLQVAPHAGSVD